MMVKRLIDVFTGDRRYFEKAYHKLYGKKDHSAEINRMKREMAKKYVSLIFASVILLSIAAFSQCNAPGASMKTENEDGILYQRPKAGEAALRIPMKLDAVRGDEEKLSASVVILVRPEEIENSFEQEEAGATETLPAIEAEIKKIVKTLNRSSSGESIVLPAELPGGIRLFWEESRGSRLPLILLLAFCAAFALYHDRYSRIKKAEALARESIIKELPEFINKLVLLLNAGLVLSSALIRIIETYEASGREVKSYFYSQLYAISKSTRETNSSMIAGLKDFAGRSGVREFTRVISILADNVDKGAELAEKLTNESELLWLTKRKLAEEKGRLAETKMTFPLVILLLSLIAVTIAPALLEM